MSEEILKALTQLFAIVTRQDGGVSEKEREYVINFFKTELDQDSILQYIRQYDEQSGYGKETTDAVKITSVKESIRILGICKKINKTLTQKQKVVVLVKLIELVSAEKNFSPHRMEIIYTVSTIFNIYHEEYRLIESFVLADSVSSLSFPEILIADNSPSRGEGLACKHIRLQLEGFLAFLQLKGVDMYFVKYLGSELTLLNGFTMKTGHVYLFPHGSTIKTQSGDAIYYSDLVADFNEEIKTTKLSFNARIDEHHFSNGIIGLHDVVISEGPGKLIGIMGASGAGKTTLLNVLAGLIQPTRGKVQINDFDLYSQKEKLQGVIGYVSQDDLLIEELTVFQNLHYNARLCFAHLNPDQLHKRVNQVLENLGLDQRKDVRVGNPLNQTLSGGQRKRLNIALELIREPAILFLDEPTSGLSSRDSENVIDLLKELSLKGKLVFVVIHQPSSDIYKMFDKMLILDTGGYPVYYGNPVEAITYFKKSTLQVDSQRGQCEVCGNINPEQIFNIMEANVVDEYGQPTTKRKINPIQWHQWYKERFKITKVEDVREQPPQSLNVPGKLKQAYIFASRDIRAKLSNRQYMLINLIEAPLLSFILAFVIRYNSAPGGKEYIFRFNDNYPAFILISIIISIFLGLMISAEEIIHDRKILKRESILNLSWKSYLMSKLSLLFTLSAIQSLLFVVVSHLILEIEWSMLLPFWFTLFTVSCMSCVLGLNISSAFNSAITVYIVIPLLLIPQMILSGIIFKYDKMNSLIGNRSRVPLLADLMASRWAYEAFAVYQFKNNAYEKPYYELEKLESQFNYRATYLADELEEKRQFISENINEPSSSIRNQVKSDLELIRQAIKDDYFTKGLDKLNPGQAWIPEQYSPSFDKALESYLRDYKSFYQVAYGQSVSKREALMHKLENESGNRNQLTSYKNRYSNESLADLLKNTTTKNRIIELNGKLIQKIDPVYLDPSPSGLLDYRAHFFAPVKKFLGQVWDTYWFDLMVIWMMALIFYVMLYFEWLKKLLNLMKG